MKKLRLWVCKHCGRAWHRKKGEQTPPYYLKCCGEYVVPARSYPKRRISKYERIQEKIRKFKQHYQTVPRTNVGTSLKLSKDTKQAFKQCRKSKHLPTLLKRANLFIHALQKDTQLYQTAQDSDKKWCRFITDEGNVRKTKGGMMSVPEVVYCQSSVFYGQYHTNMLRGIHKIELSTTPKRDIAEICKTLAHESLHWIDAQCSMEGGRHDCYWDIRLEKLEKMLGLQPK